MPAFGSRTRILALVGENENRILLSASEALGTFFVLFGYRHQVIDLSVEGGKEQLVAALNEGDVAFAYGFAGSGSQVEYKNTNLWTAARIPFASFWYDHPAYNYRQHIIPSPYILNCYQVKDHFEVRRKYMPHNNAAILLPAPAALNPFARTIPWAGRQRKFVFVKTGNRPENITAKWESYPPLLREALWGLAEVAKRDRNLDLAAATEIVFKQVDHPLDDLNQFMNVIQQVDSYIRAWRSDCLVRALLPYPADIYGQGWDYLASQPARAEFRPAFPGGEFMPKMTGYRLVANSNPLWREGVHERVLVGIAAGSVVLTDRTVMGDRVFGGLPNYVGFEWNGGLDEALAVAWEKAHDTADYLEAGERQIVQLVYTEANFIRPLERALVGLRERASTDGFPPAA